MTHTIIPQVMRTGTFYSSNNYGDFVISLYFNSNIVFISFIKSGHEKKVTATNIRNGTVKDDSYISKYKDVDLNQKSVKELISYDYITGELKTITGKPGNVKKGYIDICIYGRTYKAHRLAWIYHYGEWPNEIDHINGVRDDNRICNLRDVSSECNSKNKKLYKNNKSGVSGVSFSRESNKWIVRVSINKKRTFRGGHYEGD